MSENAGAEGRMSVETYGPITLHHGDALEVLRELPDASVDAVVTDPPYALGFMGKEWDTIGDTGRGARARTERAAEVTPTGQGHTTSGGAYLAAGVDSLRSAGRPFQDWCTAWATECLRVLKPGGHLLAFGGTRTWHRLACAVEDAGFEVRDSIAWMYGSGFPKSLDVSKAIDKAAGAEREVIGTYVEPSGAVRLEAGRFPTHLPSGQGWMEPTVGHVPRDITAPATPDAERWQGWGTALKPAFEPIVVARKPLAGTVAANVLAHGTGALNIDGCRVAATDKAKFPAGVVSDTEGVYGNGAGRYAGRPRGEDTSPAGRWPANVVLDESQAAALDEQSGERPTQATRTNPTRESEGGIFGLTAKGERSNPGAGETGGASRFFPTFRYEAKADSSERPRVNGTAHPTVKPLDLMRWLVRLVTPPGGTVLEPFAGSGTTVEACLLEGFNCVAIEREDDYLPLIRQRIARRRDPVEAVKNAGEDGGLFDLLDDINIPKENA